MELAGGTLTVTGGPAIRGGHFADTSELAPTVAALCTLADSPSTLTGIAHLRGHETDRLAALVTEINALGGNAQETEDGLVIRPSALHGGRFSTYDDHRMATAGAILGLAVEGVEVEPDRRLRRPGGTRPFERGPVPRCGTRDPGNGEHRELAFPHHAGRRPVAGHPHQDGSLRGTCRGHPDRHRRPGDPGRTLRRHQ